MNLQHLQYFRTVAETGQVTKAAKKLHISQPALSMALSTLESELEIPLFEKNGRLLHLTRGGKMFLEHVSKALDELDAGRHELARLSKSHERIIRIASTYSLSISLIPSLVKNFTVQYPDTIFHLKQGPNLEILENLANDDTDFVFGRIIPNEAKYKNIKSIPLYSEELVILMHKDHPMAKRKNIRLEELADEDFIFFHESTGYNMIVMELFQSLSITPKIRYEVYDNTTCAAIVSSNQGIALVVPSEHYDSSTLRQIKLETPHQINQTQVCMFYRPELAGNSSSVHHDFLTYMDSLTLTAGE